MAEILLLGSDRSLTSRISNFLRQDRHTVHLLREVERWRDAEAALSPELIVAVLNVTDPGFAAGPPRPTDFPTPILFIQQGRRDNSGIVAYSDRLLDRLAIPFEPEELVGRVDALIRARREVDRLWNASRRRVDFVSADSIPVSTFYRLANRAATILNSRVPPFVKPAASYSQVAARIASWADRRDAFAPGHAERVAELSALIASGLGLRLHESSALQQAALLHDIGKVTLPIAILRHRGRLAEDQRRLIQTHSERGASILAALNTDPATVDAIRHHHRPFDSVGPGAPGARLPQSARILAVAEVYDAMTASELIPAVSREVAFAKIRELRGNQLDPDGVDALVDALKNRPAMSRPAPLVAPQPGRPGVPRRS